MTDIYDSFDTVINHFNCFGSPTPSVRGILHVNSLSYISAGGISAAPATSPLRRHTHYLSSGVSWIEAKGHKGKAKVNEPTRRQGGCKFTTSEGKFITLQRKEENPFSRTI